MLHKPEISRRRVLLGLLSLPLGTAAAAASATPSVVVAGVDVGADRLSAQLWIDPRNELWSKFDAWHESRTFVVTPQPLD
jgi:hypothetical protein